MTWVLCGSDAGRGLCLAYVQRLLSCKVMLQGIARGSSRFPPTNCPAQPTTDHSAEWDATVSEVVLLPVT